MMWKGGKRKERGRKDAERRDEGERGRRQSLLRKK